MSDSATDKDFDDAYRFIEQSGIPADRWGAAAGEVYAWERRDEPDACVAVVKVYRALCGEGPLCG